MVIQNANGKEADIAIDIGAGTGGGVCRDIDRVMSTALLAVLDDARVEVIHSDDARVEVIHSFAVHLVTVVFLGIGLYACRTAAMAAAHSSTNAPNSDLNTLSADKTQ